MVILLGGGGDAVDERPVLDRFLGRVSSGGIAYWPIALDLSSYGDATAFAEAALGQTVDTWASLQGRTTDELRTFGGVFIGGGNTYHLLNEVRRFGFDFVLREVASAAVIYGGSAGAILLGSDIGTAEYFDPNNVGINDTTGLGLLGPFAVWCHYEDTHADIVRSWARDGSRPVIILTERSGAEVEGEELSAIGYEAVAILTPDGEIDEVLPGESRRLGAYS